MSNLIITGKKTKSKELPDSFDDPDMSEEEYEKIKPIIMKLKKIILNLKKIIVEYKGYIEDGIVPYTLKNTVDGVCAHIDDVIRECGYVIALYKRDESSWTEEEYQYVDKVKQHVDNIFKYYKLNVESGLKMWMALETKDKKLIF